MKNQRRSYQQTMSYGEALYYVGGAIFVAVFALVAIF